MFTVRLNYFKEDVITQGHLEPTYKTTLVLTLAFYVLRHVKCIYQAPHGSFITRTTGAISGTPEMF
jgi:hypothetical protein